MIFIGFGVWEEESTVLWAFFSVRYPFPWYFFFSVVAASAVFLHQCMDIINLNGLILVTAALAFLVQLSGESMTDSPDFLCWGWLWFLVVGGFKHICFVCWRGVSFSGLWVPSILTMEMLLPQRKTHNHNYPLKTTFILLKLCLLALGFISFVYFGLPSLRHFILHTVPSLWSSFSRWLNPPYLYIILNCIILTIAATSSLHQKLKTEESESNSHDYKAPPPEISYSYQTPPPSEVKYRYQIGFHKKPNSYEQYSLVPEGTHFGTQIQEDGDDANFISRSNWSPEASCITTTSSTMEEKPLASSRFTHKRYAKASPDAKSPLRIARPKKGETLEYTWKTLTEGRHPPLARHLRKSETWDSSSSLRSNADQSSPARNLRKSETMKHRGREDSPASPARQSLKREPSLSQDELNKRVEAFISKFNTEMRLQRQDSFTSYMEMINRGCHWRYGGFLGFSVFSSFWVLCFQVLGVFTWIPGLRIKKSPVAKILCVFMLGFMSTNIYILSVWMKSFNCYNKKEIYIVHSQSTRGCTAISTGSEVFEFCEGNTLNHTDATDHFCNWFCNW